MPNHPGTRRAPGRISAALPLFFLVALIVVSFWPLVVMRGMIVTDDIFTSDLMNGGFSYRFVLGEALKHGQLPLWFTGIYGGFPFLALAEAGACYPPNLLLFGLLAPLLALNLSILLTLLIAAVGMYLYAREIGAEVPGALVAAVGFAYSGFMMCHLKHLSMVGTVCWFPLGLLAIERSFRSASGRAPTSILWLSVIFGLQLLSGYAQTAYYSGIVYVAYFVVRHYGATSRRIRLGWFALALLLGAGIGAALIIPTRELLGLSQRAGGVSFDYAASYAYDPANIVTFLFPYARGDIGNATYRGHSIFWEDYGYVGALTLLLALFGTVRSWRRRHVKFFAGAAVVAYLIVLGPHTPLYGLVFRFVPGMNLFRFPTRMLFVVDAALCVLAALGLTALGAGARTAKSATRSPLWLPAVKWAAVAIVVLELLHSQLRQNPIDDAARWRTPPQTAAMLARDSSLFRVYSPGADATHKAAFARARGWQGDLDSYVEQREFLQPSSNVLWGIASPDGYAQLTPNEVVDIWGDQNRDGLILGTASVEAGVFIPRPSFVRILSLFNVKYMLLPVPVGGDAFELLGRVGRVYLYRNPSVLPRTYVVGRYRLAAGAAEAESLLTSDAFDPAREAILLRAPHVAIAGALLRSAASVVRYRPAEVLIHVESDAPALLVLGDTYYPGWAADVDGVETEILRANVCQRAIVVPAGRHVVRFVFRSRTAWAGMGVSGAAIIAVVEALVGRRRRRVATDDRLRAS